MAQDKVLSLQDKDMLHSVEGNQYCYENDNLNQKSREQIFEAGC